MQKTKQRLFICLSFFLIFLTLAGSLGVPAWAENDADPQEVPGFSRGEAEPTDAEPLKIPAFMREGTAEDVTHVARLEEEFADSPDTVGFLNEDGTKTAYATAFGTGTSLEIKPTLNGYKEDIILASGEQNVLADFGGLVPMQGDDDGIALLNENGDAVMHIPAIYVEDSAEVPNSTTGNMLTFEPYENGTYKLTVTVDEAFLQSEDTVYPK